MKKYILLTLLLIPFLTFAQSKKLTYGVSIFSNLSSVLYSKHDTVPPEYVEQWKEIETVKTSYSIQVFGEYAFSKKSHLTFGLGFQNTGFSNKKMEALNGKKQLEYKSYFKLYISPW
jgi:hypothetical protein